MRIEELPFTDVLTELSRLGKHCWNEETKREYWEHFTDDFETLIRHWHSGRSTQFKGREAGRIDKTDCNKQIYTWHIIVKDFYLLLDCNLFEGFKFLLFDLREML